MYAAILYFRGSYDHYGYGEKIILKNSFSYLFLTSEQKCHYAQMKLNGEAYW